MIGTATVPALGFGETTEVPVTVTIPGKTATGNYMFVVVADGGAVIAELFENNNKRSKPVKITNP